MPSICVLETGRIDGTTLTIGLDEGGGVHGSAVTLGIRAGKGLILRGVGALDVVGSGDSDAVVSVAYARGAEVHYKDAVGLK